MHDFKTTAMGLTLTTLWNVLTNNSAISGTTKSDKDKTDHVIQSHPHDAPIEALTANLTGKI